MNVFLRFLSTIFVAFTNAIPNWFFFTRLDKKSLADYNRAAFENTSAGGPRHSRDMH
ncbi:MULTISPECIES: hypothetical protein [Periweissella]|uniref:Uncharacterized protein n=2 Tax=Periweissella TaxID=2930384 RepID=A0A7X6N0R3_9LACO|nr:MULTISPECIES: hypothetical protein [Periweissella]MCM0599389.1 hypothetical protein [Periweissella fabalis]MCM0601716.1 hypothetical protein [Periweissella ghanensis]NKZ23668.1 hypothetical protein [Periweissella fabalis]CAH0418404.1 hypothetical protein WGH24286_00822 [Periweissella ghanensis]